MKFRITRAEHQAQVTSIISITKARSQEIGRGASQEIGGESQEIWRWQKGESQDIRRWQRLGQNQHYQERVTRNLPYARLLDLHPSASPRAGPEKCGVGKGCWLSSISITTASHHQGRVTGNLASAKGPPSGA